MNLIKLGKQSKGEKYFSLSSKGLGYSIKCTGETREYTFNNVNVMEWFHGGERVYISSESHMYNNTPYDLGMWSKIEITEATEVSDRLLSIRKLK